MTKRLMELIAQRLAQLKLKSREELDTVCSRRQHEKYENRLNAQAKCYSFLNLNIESVIKDKKSAIRAQVGGQDARLLKKQGIVQE